MTPQYDWMLVALSYAIAVFGSYTGLNLAIRIPGAPTSGGKAGWLVLAAIALGGGAIWSMHYIGMMAVDMGMPVTYDIPLTVASMAFAIVACAIGLAIVGLGQSSFFKLLIAGIITGLGVAAMHYTGMASMRMPAAITYDDTLFVASIVIAVVAAIAALWLAFNLRGALQRFGSAFIMGIAVCGMHYTGMAAMQMSAASGSSAVSLTSTDSYTVTGIIFAATALILTVMLIFAMRGQSSTNELAFGE